MRHAIPSAVTAILIATTLVANPLHAYAASPWQGSAQGDLALNAGYGTPVKLGPCTLFPSVIHPRASKPGFIGAKPYTKCEFPVTSIHQETVLRYQWYVWWKKAVERRSGNYAARKFTSRDVEVRCKGTTLTTWAGTTAGSIVYLGHTYYARVWQKPVQLACGA